MAIGIEGDSIQVALDRMVQEAQQAMMKQYVLSGVAKTLNDELKDFDIIARRNDHFLVLLPEVASGELTDLAGQLRAAISEHVGVTLQIGTASFPDDAATFDGLVKKAVEGMRREEVEHSAFSAMSHGKLYDVADVAAVQEKIDGISNH
jgi:hypothetical protein